MVSGLYGENRCNSRHRQQKMGRFLSTCQVWETKGLRTLAMMSESWHREKLYGTLRVDPAGNIKRVDGLCGMTNITL